MRKSSITENWIISTYLICSEIIHDQEDISDRCQTNAHSFTYVRRDVSSFVQWVAVMMWVTRFKVLAAWCTRQCGHSNRYAWWAIHSPYACSRLCLFERFQLHLVMMDPEVWWFDVRFARLPLGVAFHVPTITLQHNSMVASQYSDLLSGVMYIR